MTYFLHMLVMHDDESMRFWLYSLYLIILVIDFRSFFCIVNES